MWREWWKKAVRGRARSGANTRGGEGGGSKGSLGRKHPADSRGGQGYQRREDLDCPAPFRGTMPAAWKRGLVLQFGNVATRPPG